MKKPLLTFIFGLTFLCSFSQIANPPLPLELCDVNNPGDEQEPFSLEDANAEILNGQTGVTVSYYETQIDADNATNPIVSPYINTANPQTLFARVEDDITGNYDTTTLTLRVNPLPTPSNQIPNLELCDDNNEGFSIFDLTTNDALILNGEVGVSISYYETLPDAENGINPIFNSNSYPNIIPYAQKIYARVVSTVTGCAVVVDFDIVVNSAPTATQPSPFLSCDFDLDGFTTFDLSTKIDEITTGQANLTVTFYETQSSAENNVNALSSNIYTNIVESLQTIYVRVANGSSPCATILTLDLIADPNCDPGTVIEMQNGTFTACNGSFYDSGGLNGNYASNEDYTITICPENDGDSLGLNFTSFTTQINLDVLSIYDGDSTAGDLIGSYSAVTSPGLIVASANNASGCLTLTFVTNATGNTFGWEADIICYDSCTEITPTIDITNQTISNSGVVSISLGETVAFSGSVSLTEDAPTLTYNWNFGDGNTANSTEVSNTYLSEGLFEVTLEVINEDADDCIETDTISVVVTNENVVVYPTEFTVEELIADVFLGGQCSQVFNVSYSTGVNFAPSEPNGITYFASSGNNFPFTEGLVLSSGDAALAGGPNNSLNSSGTTSWPGDADLDAAIAGVQSNNATFIEFDFIPVVNVISFDFLMASEEYDGGSFECTFSDAFAFLLTDALGNTTNLAVIPGTDTPVLVTNVHPDNGSCAAVNEEYFGGYISAGGAPISYDGMTTLLTAQSEVNIGESYHIKLVIADDRDNIYDSAVFLRAGSLDIGELCNDIGLINAKAFNDDNSNGVLDPGELDFTQGYFTYEKNNDGIINNVNTNIGNFSIVSDNESDTYDVTFNIYDELNNCYMPVTSMATNISVLNGNVTTINFPIENNQTCEDVAVYLINPFEAPRSGFDYTNLLIVENLGNSVVNSGTVEVVLDEDVTFNELVDLSPNYSLILTATGFTLDFVDLQIGATEVIEIALTCNLSVPLDEIITNTATYVTDTNDLITDNNTSELSEIVIGSYDPNDKMEAHGPEIVYDDFITSDEYLYYTIRFQNVGTAEAIFVRIEDELDVQLDETTFQMIRSSHDYQVTRTGSSLEWFFDDIDLPAEQDDEEGSNGFVYFKIKPRPGYALGDVIPNNAAIYFDFNPPIITNTFNTTFVEPLSVGDFEANNFSIYPNPAKNIVTVTFSDNTIDDIEVTIIDIQGKVISIPKVTNNRSLELNISSLHAGMYFVQLRNGTNTVVKKLIIE